MAQDQENFYRHSTVIVDVTKDSFINLLDFHLTNQHITLHMFITINGHEIYHLCYTLYPCCQCPSGTRAARRGNQVLHPPQLDVLFDKNGCKLPGHKPNSRSTPHCCCPVNSNLQLQDLDFTLARFLVVNFTTLVPQGSAERNAIDFLVNSRNYSFAHAKEGKMSNSEYRKSMVDIENSLLVLAKVYGKETEIKQRLSDIAKQPLNTTLCLHLQTTLLQQLQIHETIQRYFAEKTLPGCLTKDLCDVTVTEGCDAHFEIWTKEDNICAIWYQNGSEIPNSKNFEMRNTGKIHSLDVMNTKLNNKGLYTVKLNDIERQACLYIKEYFTQNLRSLEGIEGETVELFCEVLDDSFPACWTRFGIKLKNDAKYEMLQVGKNHRLRIKNCNLLDAGIYTVTINTRVRSTSLTVKARSNKIKTEDRMQPFLANSQIRMSSTRRCQDKIPGVKNQVQDSNQSKSLSEFHYINSRPSTSLQHDQYCNGFGSVSCRQDAFNRNNSSVKNNAFDNDRELIKSGMYVSRTQASDMLHRGGHDCIAEFIRTKSSTGQDMWCGTPILPMLQKEDDDYNDQYGNNFNAFSETDARYLCRRNTCEDVDPISINEASVPQPLSLKNSSLNSQYLDSDSRIPRIGNHQGTSSVHEYSVTLRRQDSRLGITITEKGSQVVISDIDPAYAANLDGYVRPGDEITHVNSVSVLNASHQMVNSMIKNALSTGFVTLGLRRFFQLPVAPFIPQVRSQSDITSQHPAFTPRPNAPISTRSDEDYRKSFLQNRQIEINNTRSYQDDTCDIRSYGEDLNQSKSSSDLFYVKSPSTPPGQQQSQYCKDQLLSAYQDTFHHSDSSEQFTVFNSDCEVTKPLMLRSRTQGQDNLNAGQGSHYRAESRRPKTHTAQAIRSRTLRYNDCTNHKLIEEKRYQYNTSGMNGPQLLQQRQFGSLPSLQRSSDEYHEPYRNNVHSFPYSCTEHTYRRATSFEHVDPIPINLDFVPKRLSLKSSSSLNTPYWSSSGLTYSDSNHEDVTSRARYSLTLSRQSSGFSLKITGEPKRWSQGSISRVVKGDEASGRVDANADVDGISVINWKITDDGCSGAVYFGPSRLVSEETAYNNMSAVNDVIVEAECRPTEDCNLAITSKTTFLRKLIGCLCCNLKKSPADN